MNLRSLALPALMLAAAVVSTGCGGPVAVPFNREYTRTTINATPEVVAPIVQATLWDAVVKHAGGKDGQENMPAEVKAKLVTKTEVLPDRIRVAREIRARKGELPAGWNPGGTELLVFYQAVPGGISVTASDAIMYSLNDDGTRVPGAEQEMGHLVGDNSRENFFKSYLAEVKAKAEAKK